MELIVKIPDEAYELLKSKPALDNIAESIIANGIPYNPTGDLISREDLKEECANVVKGSNNSDFIVPPTWNKAMELIDNAPTADIKDEIAGAYNEGYMCGNKEAEKARPQGETEAEV